MPVTEMIVGLSAGLFMLIGFVFFLRLIQAWMLHKTLRDAIQRDSAVAGNLVDRIGGAGDFNAAKRVGSNDDRTGMVLIAIGIALVGFSLIAGDHDWRYGVGGGLFPLLVGAALLLRHHLQSRSGEPDIAAGA